MVLFLVGHLHPAAADQTDQPELGLPCCARPAACALARRRAGQQEGQVAASLGGIRKMEEFSQTANSG